MDNRPIPRSCQNYLTWISNQFPGYVGNWPPTQTLTLGSIGTLDRVGFTQHTSIILQPQNSKNSTLSHIKNATLDINGGLKISFNTENAFILQATQFSSTTAADLTNVKKQVAEKLKNGDWDYSWYVVVSIQLASKATIIVSESKDGWLVLNGTVGSPLPLAGNAQLNIGSENGNNIVFLTTEYPVLMYKALTVSEAWTLNEAWSMNRVGARRDDLAAAVSLREELPEMKELQLNDILSLIE
jgi:hypothetical protein